MKKATIYDLSRICRTSVECPKCPLGTQGACFGAIANRPDDVNEKILQWVKEHPIKTRQSEFLEMFPNAEKLPNNVVNVSPCHVDKKLFVGLTTVDCIASKGYNCCAQCKKEYWLAEVDENE